MGIGRKLITHVEVINSYARTHLIYAGSGFLYCLEERNVYRFMFVNDFPAFFRLRALRINSKPNYTYASEYRRRE